MESLLQILLITTLLSIIINATLKRYDLPPIIGYILAGVLITHLFSLHDTNLHALHEVSEFGIAFLMFTIGLEFSISNFKKLRKEVFLFGTLQVFVSLFIFTSITFFIFSLSLKSSIIIGSALALSSTAIVLKILNENREIRKNYGRTVLGILLFQDLAVIPILLMISFFTTTDVPLETMLLNTFYSASLVLLILFIVGKYLLTPFISFVFDARSHELFIGSVLFIAVASSYTAYHFGFSYSLGAFIGGMLLAETPFKHQIEADLTPFRDLLLGVFFVTVGMQISISYLGSHFFEILALMTVVMLFKALIIFLILKVFVMTSNALKSAIALSQVGEFSFVVLELARISGITNKEINQPLIIAVVFSMILTPFILKNLQKIVELLLPKNTDQQPLISSETSGHVVVLGYESLGQQICKRLKIKKLLYIAIDDERSHLNESAQNGDPFILGNAHQQHILYNVQVQNAMAVIIAAKDDEETLSLVNSIYHIAPSVPIVVSIRTENSSLLHDKRIRSFVHEHKEVADRMITNALSCDLNTNSDATSGAK